MKTLLIELRYSSEPEHIERMSGLVDGINDRVIQIASHFDLDILSVSHVVDEHAEGARTITCTAVCLLNSISPIQIEHETHAHPHGLSENMNCWLEGKSKLSVRVYKIDYN